MNVPETDAPPTDAPGNNPSPASCPGTAQNPVDSGGDQRIQFAPTVKPYPKRPASRDRDGSSIARRQQSFVSVPQVVSEKDRRKREKEEEKKHVNIDEHLMPHLAVAERYETRINMERPAESLGLTDQKAQQLLREHGLNRLTPPKRRHPVLKYLDCLSSLFNVLLIFAGILEYILLGVNYKDNFQNVSIRFGRGSGE
jgi:sodium/potassium-transporting ATPase subunit alpha